MSPTRSRPEVEAGEGRLDAQINKDDGIQYWQNIDADVNGMLGGFPHISRTDLLGSRTFLAKLGIGTKRDLKTIHRALEGGAGIGRITTGLLLDIAEQVDVIEPVAKFTERLKDVLGVGTVFNIGLQDWIPEEGTAYELIWMQWCVGHLTDDQLVAYLKRCATALAPGGTIVVKENLTSSGVDAFDQNDSSVTRSDESFRSIIARAGLRIAKTELQRGFPRELFPVRMYALRP